jgi:predicted NodU family carbamoyl transferase
VDGTARAQLVTREANPGLHAVLEAYARITGGVASLLQAPLDEQGGPLAYTPEDAVRAFRRGCADCLAIGPFLAESPARAEQALARRAVETTGAEAAAG